jgi:23S rRNA pseudouridine1911/1915/1917 synthase
MSRDISIIYYMKKNIYIATSETLSQRLDMFITLKSNLTRSYVQKLIKKGLVTVNSKIEKTSYRVKAEDKIELLIPDEPEEILVPENIPLDVIWEDEHIIVINKPPQMVIYPAPGNRGGTLMNALIARCNTLASIGAPLRPGVVHRLDKNTSGVIVVAKNDPAYYSLVNQFKRREVEKHYLALLYGKLKAEKGEIRAAIGRSVSDRKKMSTRSQRAKEAITQFEIVKKFKYITLAKIRIITGRTHQIRVHFASIGNPVLGDKTYGKKTTLKLGQKIINFPRQMLHASSLKLIHPATENIMEFIAPIPEDMKRAIEEINSNCSC